MNDKGIMTYMLGLIIILVFLIMLWAFFLPAIQQINVKSFAGQQKIIEDTNTAIHALPNSTQKTALLNTYNTELNSAPTNYDILSFFIQYWWIFVVIIISFGTYLLTRRNVEFQQGF